MIKKSRHGIWQTCLYATVIDILNKMSMLSYLRCLWKRYTECDIVWH